VLCLDLQDALEIRLAGVTASDPHVQIASTTMPTIYTNDLSKMNVADVKKLDALLSLKISQLRDTEASQFHPLLIGGKEAFRVKNSEERRKLFDALSELSAKYQGVTLIPGGVYFKGDKEAGFCFPVFENGRLVGLSASKELYCPQFCTLSNGIVLALGYDQEALATEEKGRMGEGADIQVFLTTSRGGEDASRVTTETGVFIAPGYGACMPSKVLLSPRKRDDDGFSDQSVTWDQIAPEGQNVLSRLQTELNRWRSCDDVQLRYMLTEAEETEFYDAFKQKDLETVAKKYRHAFMIFLSSLRNKRMFLPTDLEGRNCEEYASDQTQDEAWPTFGYRFGVGFEPYEVKNADYSAHHAALDSSARIGCEKGISILATTISGGHVSHLKEFSATFSAAVEELEKLQEAPKSVGALCAVEESRDDYEPILSRAGTVRAFVQRLDAYIDRWCSGEDMEDLNEEMDGLCVEIDGSGLSDAVCSQYKSLYRACRTIATLKHLGGGGVGARIENGMLVTGSGETLDQETCIAFFDGFKGPFIGLGEMLTAGDKKMVCAGLDALAKSFASGFLRRVPAEVQSAVKSVKGCFGGTK